MLYDIYTHVHLPIDSISRCDALRARRGGGLLGGGGALRVEPYLLSWPRIRVDPIVGELPPPSTKRPTEFAAVGPIKQAALLLLSSVALSRYGAEDPGLWFPVPAGLWACLTPASSNMALSSTCSSVFTVVAWTRRHSINRRHKSRRFRLSVDANDIPLFLWAL